MFKLCGVLSARSGSSPRRDFPKGLMETSLVPSGMRGAGDLASPEQGVTVTVTLVVTVEAVVREAVVP